MNDKPRSLRPTRPPQKAQLFSRADAGFHTQAPLELPSLLASPLGLVRLGETELEHGLLAAELGSKPSAVVVSLAEKPRLIERARRICRENGIPLLTDPMSFRTSLSAFGPRHRLRKFEFAPDDDQPPFEIADFDNARTDRVGRTIVEAQLEQGAGAVLTAGFVVRSPSDEWLRVSRRLAQLGIRARDASGANVPVVVSISARMSGFEGIAEQEMLVRSFSNTVPDAYLLTLDGVSEHHGEKRLLAALQLATRLRETGARVIVGRVGDLRRLWQSFGFDVEYGLGRYTRFSVSDYTASSGGPGPTHPRFEIPSLVASVNAELARSLLGGDLVAEAACECASCTSSERLTESVDRAPQHNAHCAVLSLKQLDGVSRTIRVERLDADLVQAGHGWAGLANQRIVEGVPQKIETQRRVIDLAIEAGLLDSEVAAPEADAI